MSNKHKKVCTNLSYIEKFLILASTITEGILISTFASLIGTPVRITSSKNGLKIFTISTWIKNYKYIIKEKKKKHNKKLLLAKSKLNRIEVLNSKTLIDSNISHDVFVLINDVLNEYNKMKEEIKNLKS